MEIFISTKDGVCNGLKLCKKQNSKIKNHSYFLKYWNNECWLLNETFCCNKYLYFFKLFE